MKPYPLDIQELREFRRGHLGYYSKGHHDSLAFVAAVAALDWPAQIEIDPRRIRHEYRRCVPVFGENFTELRTAQPGKPGAFPVTVVETVVEDV